MNKYWKIYRDSYNKIINLFPNSKTSEYTINTYKQYKFIYFIENDDMYSYMPPFHNRNVSSHHHSNKPSNNHYNSLNYLRKNIYHYQGEIGGRKKKLIKLKQITNINT